MAGCGVGLAGKEGLTNGRDRIAVTGRALLISDQAEEAGYGLYSYLLFESPPDAEAKPVYLAAIRACLKEFPDLGRLEKAYPRAALNAMFMPVRRDMKDAKVPSPEQLEQERLKSWAEEILQWYNYGRSQAILNRLAMVQKNGGPYLVSSLGPVSSGTGTNPFLFQDLSAVRLVPRQEDQTTMVYEWVLDFVDRVSNPRPVAWDYAVLAKFGNEMLDARQPAFAHRGVRADQLDLKKWIVFPRPDNLTKRTFHFPPLEVGDKYLGSVLVSFPDRSPSVLRPVSFPSLPALRH